MIEIPIKARMDDIELDLVVRIRGMQVTFVESGAPKVVLDDYDVVHPNGTDIDTDLLDDNGEFPLAVEGRIEDVILPRRPIPGPGFRPQPKPADGQLTEAAA